MLFRSVYSLCPDTETEVAIAHVFGDDEDADPYSSSYKKAYGKLQGYANDLRRNGYDRVKIITLVGEVFEEINHIADEEDVELIMVASHGKGFFRSAILGSTTFDLARASNRPMFVAKTDDKDEINDDLLRKIILPTDFSKKSLAALNLIRSLREHVSEIVFLHIVERSRNQSDLEDKFRQAEAMLKELVDEMNIFGISATYRIFKGAASKKICKLAEEVDASLVVMTKTGAGLVKGLVMGSTAQNVTLNSERSLLLFPAIDNNDN